MKKLISVILAIILIFAVGCSPKSPQNPGGSQPVPPGPDNPTPEIPSEGPIDNFDDNTKPILLFLIDEGISDKGLIGKFGTEANEVSPNKSKQKDRTKLQAALENICEALEPLKENFRPAVLIYPQWYYEENGFNGRNPSSPRNRFSNDLLFALNYLAENYIPFYFEAYSSGGWTNQNGELGNLPLVPLSYGSDKKYQSVEMDLDTVPFLIDEYGKWFAGFRFHELIGTHIAHTNGRGTHYFEVKEEVIKTFVDVCSENNLHLVWGDHSFNTFNIDNPASNLELFKSSIEYAIDNLPQDKLTLNWSNNGWPTDQYFTDNFTLKGYKNSRYGMSVQDWFWQETDSGTMTDVATKWYTEAYLDCPPEIMAAFTLRALKSGYSLIQYESANYMFNATIPLPNSDGSTAAYEVAPDYSLRMTAKRMFNYINEEYSYKPSTNILDYYDSDTAKHRRNRTSDPAKRYSQNTVFAFDKENKYKAFDTYNNQIGTFYEQSFDRLRDYIYDGEVISMSRANLTFSGTDEIIILKNKNNKKYLEAYNLRNGKLYSNDTIAASNASGEVVQAFALNIHSSMVTSLDGDSDEIILVRKKDNTYTLEAYRINAVGSSGVTQTFSLDIYPDSNQRMAEQFGSATFEDENFVQMLPIRTAFAYSLGLGNEGDYNNRKVDGGIIKVSKTASGIRYSGKVDGTTIDKSITVTGEILCVSTMDINFDIFDELVVAVKVGDETTLKMVNISTGELLDKSISISNFTPKVLFTNRVGTYTKNW